MFIAEYVRCWNASEAARRAGYNGKSNSVGSQLLANINIFAEIERRKSLLIMSAEEVAIRLTEQAKASYADYLKSDGTVDLDRLLADGKGHLIKKMKAGRDGLEIEFYDAQAALGYIGKIHKLFVDRQESAVTVSAATVTVYLPDNGRGDADE